MPNEKQKILIVDDDATTRRLVKGLLQREYLVAEADSGEQALEVLPVFRPDLVLLDILMPGIDGYATCRQIRASRADIQIVMISALSSAEEQLRAFETGADDYLVKPFDPQDVRSRVRLHFQLRNAQTAVELARRELESHSSTFRRMSEHHAKEINAIQDAAVFALAKVAESRDLETGGHLARMRAYSQILAEELASGGPYADQIDARFLQNLYRASPLHDIGKVGICDEILLKPGRLTPEAFKTIQQHTIMGADVLDQAAARLHEGGFLVMGAVIARFHHEKFDGSGYPDGLAGEGIPLPARIVAVADVYDALTSTRPYKPAFTPDVARSIILRGTGQHFDPVVVEAFCRRFDDFVQARETIEDDFHSNGGRAFGAADLTALATV